MLRKLAVTVGLVTILGFAAYFAPHEPRDIHAAIETPAIL